MGAGPTLGQRRRGLPRAVLALRQLSLRRCLGRRQGCHRARGERQRRTQLMLLVRRLSVRACQCIQRPRSRSRRRPWRAATNRRFACTRAARRQQREGGRAARALSQPAKRHRLQRRIQTQAVRVASALAQRRRTTVCRSFRLRVARRLAAAHRRDCYLPALGAGRQAVSMRVRPRRGGGGPLDRRGGRGKRIGRGFRRPRLERPSLLPPRRRPIAGGRQLAARRRSRADPREAAARGRLPDGR
mmetsp:Transcript_47758/g.158240  ORF Transcript_47758/g.158240 Transcript_47758/m.158240 type:complete len:244 (+) Transcript_47758:813-1544(+)